MTKRETGERERESNHQLLVPKCTAKDDTDGYFFNSRLCVCVCVWSSVTVWMSLPANNAHTYTQGYQSYLVGCQEVLRGSTVGHHGTGTRTNMCTGERMGCGVDWTRGGWLGLRGGVVGAETEAWQAHSTLFKPASRHYTYNTECCPGLCSATCCMENSSRRRTVSGLWSGW